MAKETRHYYKEVRLRQVRALMQIARQGGFAAAARELGLSGPSIWVQIRSLEREFGASLVQARGSEVKLTDDGELLVRLASPLVEGFDSLRSIFAERRGELRRTLTLTTTATTLSYELAPIIASYRKSNPEVELSLIDRPSLEALSIFEQGRADIAIIGQASDSKLPTQCQAEELTPYVFHLACLPDHPLLTKKRISLNDIARHALILPGEGSAVRQQVLDTLSHLSIQESSVAVSSSNFTLLTSYVQMGYGVGVFALGPQMTKHWNTYTGGKLRIRDVSKIFGHERVIMLHRTQGHELQHVKQFRETVIKHTRRQREAQTDA
jgi:molybdate transport repressor ModE-like protein